MIPQRHANRVAPYLAIALTMLTAVAGCSNQPQPTAAVRVESDFTIMGTEARIVVYADSESTGRKASEAGLRRLESIDQALSTFRQDSEISAINRAAGAQAVAISHPTARAIHDAVEYTRLSGGAFNPLVGRIVHLWRQSADEGRLPSDEDIADTLDLLDVARIELSQQDGQHYCRLAQAGMQLDLGGHAKGWAADEAISVIRQLPGVRAVLVMLGGDGAGWSDATWTRPWSFGIQDPRQAQSRDIIERLNALNLAVVTSGNYYRYFEIGGLRYSHIIDPRSGRPIETDVASATVVDSDAGRADALATACMVLGTEAALQLLETIAGAEGLIFQQINGQLVRHSTSAYPKSDN